MDFGLHACRAGTFAGQKHQRKNVCPQVTMHVSFVIAAEYRSVRLPVASTNPPPSCPYGVDVSPWTNRAFFTACALRTRITRHARQPLESRLSWLEIRVAFSVWLAHLYTGVAETREMLPHVRWHSTSSTVPARQIERLVPDSCCCARPLFQHVACDSCTIEACDATAQWTVAHYLCSCADKGALTTLEGHLHSAIA
jgi:hypothetical protein